MDTHVNGYSLYSIIIVTPSFPGMTDQNRTAPAGGNITISCNTRGQPLPNITWFKNGEILIENDSIIIMETTDSRASLNSTLILLNISRSDEGIYQCVATNFLFVLFEAQSPLTNLSIQCKTYTLYYSFCSLYIYRSS